MLEFITANAATILISIVLLAAITLIMIHLIKNKKRDRSFCGCNCSGCPMSAKYHTKIK